VDVEEIIFLGAVTILPHLKSPNADTAQESAIRLSWYVWKKTNEMYREDKLEDESSK
jgi:hypothetical protein